METKIRSRVDVLAGLLAGDVERVLGAGHARRFEAGARIFGEGDEGDELFIVSSGRVRITKEISPGLDRTLVVVVKGGVFGELTIADSGPRSATAAALEPTEVVAVGREDFQRLVQAQPALGIKLATRLAQTLAERLRFTNDLLREAAAWGLEATGAANLNLEKIMPLHPDVVVTLITGKELEGRLLKVERSAAGVEVTIRGRDDRLVLVPYHAIVAFSFPGDVLAGATEEL